MAKYGIFRPFGPKTALGTERNPRLGPKSENRNFPVLGVPKREKQSTTLSGMVVRNCVASSYILANRSPMGGKPRNTGISGHFGPVLPLAF